ncbi:MAG: gamma-butyrobetaine hydroxylase-like domain-containing protein [Flavobacteriaceae bacterium]
MTTTPHPTEIRLSRDRKTLTVSFEDGFTFAYPAELLRVESPSAEVRGHTPSQRKTIGGKRHVAITAVEPVGNYAIRIAFDDLHATGIYSWTFLRELAAGHDRVWAAYLEALKQKGLSREP